MKKILAILLCLSTMLSFVACDNKNYEVILDTYKCDKCNGSGIGECPHCMGSGDTCDSENCPCKFHSNCWRCEGSGEYGDCYECDGKGERKATFYKYDNGEVVFQYYLPK